MKNAFNTLKEASAKATTITNHVEQAKYYKNTVAPAMEALRKPADELEMIVDKKFWPFPSYGDLIFEV